MYKHPRRDKGLASVMAILAPIALLLMVALVPIHVGSHAVTANLPVGPLIVDGYVNSSAGVPVNLATVHVTVWNGTTQTANLPNTSDSSGFYMVTVSPGLWDVGFLIVVWATNGIDVGQNSTVVIDPLAFGMTIDVKLGTIAIPEFGSPAMTALTVSAIGIMVVFYARRRGSISL